MSLDGASRKNVSPLLRLAATNTGAVEAAPRRSKSEDIRALQDARAPKPGNLSDDVSSTGRRYPRYVPGASVSQMLIDMVLIAMAQASVLLLIFERLSLESPVQAGIVVALSVLILTIFLYATGCYRRDAILSMPLAMSRLPIALGFAAILTFIFLRSGFPYVFPSEAVYVSNSRDVTIVLIGTSLSLGAVLISRALFRSMLAHSLFRRRVLVIGSGKRARHIQELNESHAHRSLQEIHFANESILKETPAKSGEARNKFSKGTFPASAINDLSMRLKIDEVVVALDDRRGVHLDDLIQCKANGYPVTDFNSFIERLTGRIDLHWLEISWLLHSSGFQMRLIDAIVKRAMDIVLSAFALFISLPVLVVAIVAIRLDSPGSVFYRQERVTLNGRVFWLYKLRSMRSDAEQDGPKWADEGDARITRVGAFLRRTRLDEIPQLLNILWGDMSIVGPRPERPCFVDELSQELRLYKLRHNVRAGLTGWAQINYRYGASLEDAQRKLEYDLFYIKNFSLLRDGAIMLQTLRVLLWPDGVH